MNKKIAIVTTESLPAFNAPCGGGGVRVWGLMETLRQHDVDCALLLHENRQPQANQPYGVELEFYKPELLHRQINSGAYSAVLFEQWQPMTFLKERVEIPVIVDLPGPLALEYYWRDPGYFYQHITDKAHCLAQGDYFLCALERQRGYYAAWLTWAGVSPAEDRLAVVPFTMHAMPTASHGQAEQEPQIFWGGMFWAWQERKRAFDAILETLAHHRAGQLVIAGNHEAREGFIIDPNHPHLTTLGLLPFTEFITELKRSTVAVDLCEPTEERRLASDLRTGTALWTGTPCIVTPASPWAKMIEEKNAGWVLDYGDEKGLKSLIKDLVLEQTDIRGKRRGAREVSELISARENVEPLVRFLKNPQKRAVSKPFFDARTEDREKRLQELQEEVFTLRHQNQSLQNDLDSIRSKALFRFYKGIKGWFGS